MKRLLTLTVLLGLVAFGAGVAKANLLLNPDLDFTAISSQVLATPSLWTAASSKSISGVFTDGMSSETFCNVLQPGGFGLFFKPFQGSGADLVSSSISQDVAASAGNAYMLTGWAGAGGGYIGLTDPSVKSQFVLEFLDSSASVIGTSLINLNLMGLGTPNGNPFGYNQYTVMSGVAPVGTVAVRSIAQMVDAYGNPLGGDQAFVVDSFDLEVVAVPEPTIMALAGLGGLTLLLFRRHNS